MEAALHALQQGNIRIGFLQEKKVPGGIHTRYGLGYKVWEAKAESRTGEGSLSSGDKRRQGRFKEQRASGKLW